MPRSPDPVPDRKVPKSASVATNIQITPSPFSLTIVAIVAAILGATLRGSLEGDVNKFEEIIKSADLGIEFVRANVGDRYVIAALQERNWLVGGENSGHIVCFQHTTTGDAIIAALQV